MGLIQAGLGSINGVLADQWKEFFVCESMSADTLVVKGTKRIGNRSSNRYGSDNVITQGSGIVVADGQCMIIVDQGKVVEVCAEPGQFTYDASTSPSIFTGNLGDSIKETFKEIGKRFTFGGDTGKDQRVYYFNTKEIINNAFALKEPAPFRVVDENIGLDIDVSLTCDGLYSYRITDPILFYTNVCGNISGSYTRSQIDSQLDNEFISALQPSFAKLSAQGIRPSALPGHTEELAKAMNETLTDKWSKLRGISVVSVAVSTVNIPKEDADMIKAAQRAAINRDPNMAAAQLAGAQADAMREAAKNPNGAMTGFMGMNMAGAAGGMNANALFEMGAKQPKPPIPKANTWTCSCGAKNTGKFCMECGKPKPVDNSWTCSCGTTNTGKFCTECGKPKPASQCSNCGWQPEAGQPMPKFCPECGSPLK